MVIDPLGEVLVSAAGSEATIVTEIDPAVVASTRERFPFLADRRSPTVSDRRSPTVSDRRSPTAGGPG
jgi:predicted amidohydrolase